MGRFLVSLVLAVCLVGYIAYHFELFTDSPDKPRSNRPRTVEAVDVGPILFPAREMPLIDPPVGKDRSANSIRIAGQTQPVDKVEISSLVDGQLLFLGEEIPLAAQALAGTAPFLLEPCNIAMLRYQTAELVPNTDRLQYVDREMSFIYRRLIKGHMVTQDQTLAVLNPLKAIMEKRAKITKVASAEAERRAAVATAKEAKAQAERTASLWRTKAASEQEKNIAELTATRHQEEAVGKEQAVKQFTVEMEQAQFVLDQHTIRNQLPVNLAIIKEVYKERGEAVKPQDKIMELQSLDRFMAEGFVEVQHLQHIKPGMSVTIEPTQEDAPLRTFKAHRGEITSVAVTKDEANPLIVSASEDRSVLVWDRKRFGPVHYFPHAEAVRAVACSPLGSSHNLILSGCSDGTIYVWDLDQPTAQPRKVKDNEPAHRDAVSSLAFTLDGQYFASGAVDGSIKLWKVDGTEIYPFTSEYGATDTHQGAVTSLNFTPQCRLVSAARDNTVRVWELHEKGVKLVGNPTGGRSGTVNQLGVSRDGRYMLFDQGKTLQMLSVDNGQTINTVQNATESSLFDTVAIFSPNSTLLLTAGASEGRLQLWCRPTAESRAFEVRQLVADERSTVTCAAFAQSENPAGSVAVSGTKDGYVYLWPVPSTEDVRTHRIQGLPLSAISPTLDAATRQVRVAVEVANPVSPRYPTGRLIPNRPVTIVID